MAISEGADHLVDVACLIAATSVLRRGVESSAAIEGADIAMDVKEAAQTARKYVTDVFADDEIGNVGLEEVEF